MIGVNCITNEIYCGHSDIAIQQYRNMRRVYMIQVIEHEILEIENLVSYRGIVNQNLIERVGKDMEQKIKEAGGKNVGFPITATYKLHKNGNIDLELLIPVDKKLENIEKYQFKNKLRIVNALMAKNEGNISNLQKTCDAINAYIIENKLIPVTVGYNVTRINQNSYNPEIFVYVGVSDNIL